MSKISKTSFEALQKEWYQKLKDDGFEDVEASNWRIHPNLSQTKRDVLHFNHTLIYYQRCRSFLHHYTFDSLIDKCIWKLYSEGFSYREIAKRLKEIDIDRNKDYVNRLVVKLIAIMKVTEDENDGEI